MAISCLALFGTTAGVSEPPVRVMYKMGQHRYRRPLLKKSAGATTMESKDLISTIEAMYGLCMAMRGRLAADSLVIDQVAKVVLSHLPEAQGDLQAALDLQVALRRRKIDNAKELGTFTARIEEFKNSLTTMESAP